MRGRLMELFCGHECPRGVAGNEGGWLKQGRSRTQAKKEKQDPDTR